MSNKISKYTYFFSFNYFHDGSLGIGNCQVTYHQRIESIEEIKETECFIQEFQDLPARPTIINFKLINYDPALFEGE